MSAYIVKFFFLSIFFTAHMKTDEQKLEEDRLLNEKFRLVNERDGIIQALDEKESE